MAAHAVESSDPGAQARGAFQGHSLYVEPNSHPKTQADLWRHSDPAGAAIMDDLASVPGSHWLAGQMPDVTSYVDDAVTRAGHQLQTFVVYNLPHRDCGAWSAGGLSSAGAYADFIDEIAAGLGGRLAIVVLEPDGLALTTCLSDTAEADRLAMVADAVDTLTAAGGAVYIDAGDSNWIQADEMADRLLEAGVERAAGFALNVAHTEFTWDEVAYAQELRAIVGEGAHFVIDTGRNGLGPSPDNEWCNPQGRGNGRRPTLDDGTPGLDALLWIKPPGGSDGSCYGGPIAGAWWPEYARQLHERSPF